MSGKYALIIGNSEYIDPGLAQLSAPGKDAEDFARVLKDKEIGAFDDVKVVVNEPSASVIEAIDEFFDQKKPDDMLVLYFSGHGIKDEIGSLYLAFKNTVRSRLRSTAIKSDYIKEAMDQSRSKRQVLILDCCNSGAFPQGTKAELGGAMGMTQAFQGYGRFVLTASDATQFAWEGDKVIGETDNSLFTHFLVKGMEGDADNDGDGRITVDELYDYAYNQITRVTPKQTPTKSSSKQEGEIVLRQNIRIENIKPVNLPDDLIDEMEDHRPYVREAAVQKLEKILKGKNLGLARSAADALEKIANDENTTRRVSQVATQVLDSYKQALQKAEEERLAKLEAERLDIQKAEEERIALAKIEREHLAEEEHIVRAKFEVDHIAKEKLITAEETETKRKAGEEDEPLTIQKTEMSILATHKTSILLTWWGRTLLGATVGFVISLIATIFLVLLDNGPWIFVDVLLLMISCGIAGLVTYPHKNSILVLVLAFIISAFVTDSSIASENIVFGAFFGFPIGALSSRILYRFKVIK